MLCFHRVGTYIHTLEDRATRGSGIVSRQDGARPVREAAGAKVRACTAAGAGGMEREGVGDRRARKGERAREREHAYTAHR